MPSLHAGAWQTVAMQTPLAQSAATRQLRLSTHLPQSLPQSMSVSLPFLTVSLHVAAAHTFAVHTPLPQSAHTIVRCTGVIGPPGVPCLLHDLPK